MRKFNAIALPYELMEEFLAKAGLDAESLSKARAAFDEMIEKHVVRIQVPKGDWLGRFAVSSDDWGQFVYVLSSGVAWGDGRKTRAQVLAERFEWRQRVERARGPNDVVLDPGDEIICDMCNDLVEGDEMYEIEGWLWCPRCKTT